LTASGAFENIEIPDALTADPIQDQDRLSSPGEFKPSAKRTARHMRAVSPKQVDVQLADVMKAISKLHGDLKAINKTVNQLVR
jgi:hypothetical protein